MIGIAILTIALQQRTPIDFGREAIRQAAGSQADHVSLSIAAGKKKESYRISSRNGQVTIVGTDANGAMYGAFEFAERLRNEGHNAWKTQTEGEPFLPDRGLNLFTTLPWNYAKNDTDYDSAALTDPNRWWFQNDDYWTTLLDTMANSRLNWLDIHGMWDVSVTNAPNLYAYFVTSPTFPKVGVSDDVKAINLARLNKVVSMAHERGIRVSLMAYEAGLRIPQNPNPPYQATEQNTYTYTKEVVEQMIRKVPGLDAIGFRIGESGKSESFFKCYGDAVKLSGRNIPLVTRSWITRRQRVLPLARASNDFTVEIKYNGEQWGAPYPVAGGRMATWNSYSFEDYLSDSGASSKNAKTWLGWPAEGGGKWPNNPYKEVWQVRANGTHRIFPFYNPDWVRRSISAMKVGTASGYTIEGEDAYYPKSSAYYLANPQDQFCNWIHQRDEMYWMTWGRLGYDPKTPDSVFDAKVESWFGGQGKTIAKAWKEASEVVPLAYMAKAIGPDHRDHAPELETGGDTQSYIEGQPFDPLVFRPINESIAYQTLGIDDGRIGVDHVGSKLGEISTQLRQMMSSVSESTVPPNQVKRYRELKNSIGMLSALAQYYSGRFLSATQTADLEGIGKADLLGQRPPITRGKEDNFGSMADPWSFGGSESSGSGFSSSHPFMNVWRGWQILSNSSASTFYRPFTEKLRMHTNTFSWLSQRTDLTKEGLKWLNENAGPFVGHTTTSPRPSTQLSWQREQGNLKVHLPAEGLDAAWLLYKPLPSPTFFHKIPMVRVGSRFEVTLTDERFGTCLVAEVQSGRVKNRIPSFIQGQKPYLVVPARPGPTAQIYGCEEAMAYLDSHSLSPEKYGQMVVAPRGSNFFRVFNRTTRRKLLDPISRGMTLIILQQDFTSGRYPLDFLPRPLLAANNSKPNSFDPGGLLGLPKIDTREILWQHFLPSDGWEVPGNGGVAHMHFGKGDIFVVAGRLMQRVTNPGCARALKQILTRGDKSKPTVLIDPGTEGAAYSTAFYPDLLNAVNVPFLTLGEVIAKEQGVNSLKQIQGPIMDDDVLSGQGQSMANAFLKGRVQKISAIPTPTLANFESVRLARKKELMRTLGLDPMPVRTPLNVRKTGTLQGNGFHIEKIVYESRPKFYVTAHVYIPDHKPQQRLPVIVNVNGHWAHKKGEDRLQLRSQFQALQGYIAITIDSPGWSFEGNSLIERRPEGTHNDFMLVEGGTNTTGYYVWDAIRGLDYMATRDDTDMDRVGITGASGGGLATLYTFAADDRYKAAVPVVYMSSMELAPDNGCLCNHVPGTSQVGDRSDVIGIQAPKPVYIMGAENDGEFTPPAMRLTHKKMEETWSLFGKGQDTFSQIYAGGHDYNQPMRESMIGFFNKYLKGQGDGSPVHEPALKVIDPEDRSLLVLDQPIPDERTMRDLSKEYLDNAPQEVSATEVFKVNGGLPAKSDIKYRELNAESKRPIVFEPLPGLSIPGLLVLPKGKVNSLTIVMVDAGKSEGLKLYPGQVGEARLYIDGLGIGELSDIDMRYSVYLGTSVPFLNGWSIARAAEAMRKYSTTIRVIGKGPVSSQAAMFAGLMNSSLAGVTGNDCLRSWKDVFDDGMSEFAVQPRAHLCGSLDHLRSLVKNASWTFKK